MDRCPEREDSHQQALDDAMMLAQASVIVTTVQITYFRAPSSQSRLVQLGAPAHLAASLERVLAGDGVDLWRADPLEHARRYWASNWSELWRAHKDDVIPAAAPAAVRALAQDLVDAQATIRRLFSSKQSSDRDDLYSAAHELYNHARTLVLEHLTRPATPAAAATINVLADKLRAIVVTIAGERTGTVYLMRFARAPRNRQYKIGFSTQVDARATALSRAYPFEAAVIATFPGSIRDERLAHWIFESLRFSLRREFFAADRRIRHYFRVRTRPQSTHHFEANDVARR
jgi:T5orf172 domain